MSDKKGSKPTTVKKGYQPQKPTTQKPGKGKATGGYQPTTSKGNNPGNKPPPKKP